MIKAFWWRGGPGAGNFGDRLTPLLLERLCGTRVAHAAPAQADIVAVGSILEPCFWQGDAAPAFGGHIWGSGRMLGEVPMAFPQAKVAAVRGRLSHQRVGCAHKDRVALGDPGLLCHLLVEPVRKLHVLGIVPHWTERRVACLHQLAGGRGVCLIDPCMDACAVLQAIAGCEHILSSSLHGLIAADALGVPNEWLWLGLGNEVQRGVPTFKFRDYYSVFGLEDKPVFRLRHGDGRDTILARFGPYQRPGLEAIRAGLLDAFPLT